MGDMADFALADVAEMENLRDEYHSGRMSGLDAFDYGFVGPNGAEEALVGNLHDYNNGKFGLDAYEQISKYGAMLTKPESVQNINRYEAELTTLKGTQNISKYENSKTYLTSNVNDEAIDIGRTSELPKCNMCREDMTPRAGKFGKFYFCRNVCEGQKTVSDKYWQNFKAEAINLRKVKC